MIYIVSGIKNAVGLNCRFYFEKKAIIVYCFYVIRKHFIFLLNIAKTLLIVAFKQQQSYF